MRARYLIGNQEITVIQGDMLKQAIKLYTFQGANGTVITFSLLDMDVWGR